MLELPDFDTAYARTFFPALDAGWALFENAGGTLVPTTVLDRLNAYMRESQVQPGAGYAASELAAQRMAQGHRMMAELLNAAPEEVMVGPSTTMNVYLLAQALRPGFRDGDEIIVTDLDHEANNGAWRRLAETGLRVVEWKVDPETAELRPDDLAALLTDRTRLVCFTQCSNITGGFNDVPAIARMAHEAGALVCVDGVAFAPHRLVDVREWDVDFYLCSTYKIYGPHLGLLYGKRDHLLNARGQNHYFIPESSIPLKLNPGGPNHELTAALAGITDYFALLHRHHFGESNLPARERLGQLFGLFARHEEEIAAPFVDYLAANPRTRLLGRATAAYDRRAPTLSFVVEGRDSREIAAALQERGLAVGSGDFYAARLIDAMGLRERHGVIRASMVHYNTTEEVARLISALDEVVG